MNGLAPKHYVADCPLVICRWSSEPLATVEAAQEARRAHVNTHTHGELVEHIATISTRVAEYERSERNDD